MILSSAILGFLRAVLSAAASASCMLAGEFHAAMVSSTVKRIARMIDCLQHELHILLSYSGILLQDLLKTRSWRDDIALDPGQEVLSQGLPYKPLFVGFTLLIT